MQTVIPQAPMQAPTPAPMQGQTGSPGLAALAAALAGNQAPQQQPDPTAGLAQMVLNNYRPPAANPSDQVPVAPAGQDKVNALLAAQPQGTAGAVPPATATPSFWNRFTGG